MTYEADEQWFRQRLAELEEENRHLRAAAARFGELAERLSEQLIKERRLGTERRQKDRLSDDRRMLSKPDER